MTFATPHARAIVLGTRLRLAVTPVLTRLDVDEGEVVFERLHDGARVHVSAGRHALSSEGDAAALRAAASTEGRATAAATAPAPARVLAFNFEDGVLPPAFYNGELGVAPPRPGNRHAVMGGLNVYGAHTNTVALGLTPAVAYHAERLVLAFDYWLGADGRLLEITMFDSDRHQNYSLWLDDVVTEAWGHAEVRLVDLKPHRRKVPMEPGDRILNILIKGGRMGGKPFFVDNIELYEASTDRFGRRSTAGGPARLRSTP